jgi:hypothetical protein
MDDILKYGVFGVAKPLVDKLTDSGLSQEQVDQQIKSALDKQKADQEKSMSQQQGMGQPSMMKKGGKVTRSSASKRADGCCTKGFTRA